MAGWWRVKRFDTLELCLALGIVTLVLASWILQITPESNEEARQLERTYGPDHNSFGLEELVIRDFFRDRRDGFYLDIGASHHQIYSNTYFLEHNLGWQGIAVEPMTNFEPGYLEYRPRTRFRPFFVSDVSNQSAKMYTHGDKFMATSSNKTFVERFGLNPTEFVAPTITLNDLLDREKVEAVDFVSMDIELSEPKALAGFDINRFKPELFCIEAHLEVRQQILDYFARNGYVLVGKYVRADDGNLYFAPLK